MSNHAGHEDRRLIEDYLPIAAISAEASREKSVRKGHISTLHLWWARRPLVACRAAVYGALVPADRWVKDVELKAPPEDAAKAEKVKNGKKKGLNRRAAKEFVTKLCRYPKSNPTNPEDLRIKHETEAAIVEAQRHILEAHADRLTAELAEAKKTGKPPAWVDEFKFTGDRVSYDDIVAGRAPRPRVLDMFAGGGAIPLEALRLGCEAYALDLNPVAHIIELCTLVYPQKYGRPDPTVRGMTGAPQRGAQRGSQGGSQGGSQLHPHPSPLPEGEGKVGDASAGSMRSVHSASPLPEGEGKVGGELAGSMRSERSASPLPEGEGKVGAGETTWGGLAEEVRYWGQWVLERVRKEIGDLYPPIPDPEVWETPPEIAFDRQTGAWNVVKAGTPKRGVQLDPPAAPASLLPDEPDEECEDDEDGGSAARAAPGLPAGFLQPVAYLWTRTVACKNPACKATVPLVRQTWLCKKAKRYVALRMHTPQKAKRVTFEVVESDTEKGLGFDPAGFSKAGNATCPFCGTVADNAYVKSEGQAGRMGVQPMAVVCTRPGKQGKVYLAADSLPPLLPREAQKPPLPPAEGKNPPLPLGEAKNPPLPPGEGRGEGEAQGNFERQVESTREGKDPPLPPGEAKKPPLPLGEGRGEGEAQANVEGQAAGTRAGKTERRREGSYLPDDDTIRRRIAELCQRTGLTVPDEPIITDAKNSCWTHLYGLTTFGHLFTPRQMLCLLTFTAAVREAYPLIPGHEHGKAVLTLISLVLDRAADRGSTLCHWDNAYVKTGHTFGRQALPMVWDFSEVNPLGDSSGDLRQAIKWATDVVSAERSSGLPALVTRGSATHQPIVDGFLDAVITDPPYYDNVPYADISDFFYVWLKRSIGHLYPEHFATAGTPKKQEAVADATRHGGDKQKAIRAYEEMMAQSLAEAHRVLKPGGTLVIVYAHKTTLGWSTLVDALRRAGFTITEAWPLDTEMKTRLRGMDSAALASSIFLVGRKRETALTPGPAAAGRGQKAVGNYEDDVQPELQQIVRERVETLWEQGISGADLVIACVGAGLRAFTKYERVEYANGEPVPAERFLSEVESVVLDTILARLSREAGAALTPGPSSKGRGEIAYSLAGVDPATRFYVLWRYTYRFAELDAGEAIVFANGTHVELDGPLGLSSGARALVEKKKGKYRLRDFTERGHNDRLGMPDDDGQPVPLIDALHRTLWLMEHEPRNLAQFLIDAQPNREQMRLVAQALAGPALKGGELADVSPTAEQSALAKLTANWRSVVDDNLFSPEERADRQRGQRRMFE